MLCCFFIRLILPLSVLQNCTLFRKSFRNSRTLELVFNWTPESRSCRKTVGRVGRAVARFVLLAAGAKHFCSTGLQSLGVAGRRWEDWDGRLPGLFCWRRGETVLLNGTPKSRSCRKTVGRVGRAVARFVLLAQGRNSSAQRDSKVSELLLLGFILTTDF